MTRVLAANSWTNNGDLIVDVAHLHFREGDSILDPTYGHGIWWKRADELPMHQLSKLSNDPGSTAYSEGHDFRSMPFDDNSFDVVAYDPPYAAKGGRDTSTIDDMDARFGLHDAPPTPIMLQDLIDDGLTEAVRVSRRLVLVKCMTYVSSGKLWLGEFLTLQHALHLGCRLEDRFIHVGGIGPDPKDRRQIHARNNASMLYVLRVPRKKAS